MFDTVSDLYKDVNGVRPSQTWLDSFYCASLDEQTTQFDSLCNELEAEIAREKTNDILARAEYESRITGMMNDYSIDRATAIRWDMDAYGVDIAGAMDRFGDATQEIEHYLWNNRLPMASWNEYVTEIKDAT